MSKRSSISPVKRAAPSSKARPLLIASLMLGASSPLFAQTQIDDHERRARIDDFSVAQPSRASSVQIEQLGSGNRDVSASKITSLSGPLDKPSVEMTDLGNAGPQNTAPTDSTPMAQVAGSKSLADINGAHQQSEQLSNSAQSRDLSDTSISSTAASRPTATERLSGTDRCEPGQETAQSENCANILEKRAEQYASTQAPTLSAEQALLANNSDDGAAIDSLATRLDLGSRDNPNASLPANQEVASIYLENPQGNLIDVQQPNEPSQAVEALVQVLRNGGAPANSAP